MLSVLILLLLSWSFYIGYNRGLILQTFYCFGALVSLLFAHHGYKALAGKLALWVPYSNPAEGAATLFFKDGIDRSCYHSHALYSRAPTWQSFVSPLG
ncbi:membrane protein [Streptococcus equi subsp. zooepidemicus SzAM35]|nr:membrane protein [Streptococcus equi subsp. zooepidemicus SzAM35]